MVASAESIICMKSKQGRRCTGNRGVDANRAGQIVWQGEAIRKTEEIHRSHDRRDADMSCKRNSEHRCSCRYREQISSDDELIDAEFVDQPADDEVAGDETCRHEQREKPKLVGCHFHDLDNDNRCARKKGEETGSKERSVDGVGQIGGRTQKPPICVQHAERACATNASAMVRFTQACPSRDKSDRTGNCHESEVGTPTEQDMQLPAKHRRQSRRQAHGHARGRPWL